LLSLISIPITCKSLSNVELKAAAAARPAYENLDFLVTHNDHHHPLLPTTTTLPNNNIINMI
jgi:hypothetical protein